MVVQSFIWASVIRIYVHATDFDFKYLDKQYNSTESTTVFFERKCSAIYIHAKNLFSIGAVYKPHGGQIKCEGGTLSK